MKQDIFIKRLMQKIEKLRTESLELTQEEMAERYSVSRKSYTNWIHGIKKPSDERIKKLAKDLKKHGKGFEIIHIENTSSTIVVDDTKSFFWLYDEERKKGMDLPQEAGKVLQVEDD